MSPDPTLDELFNVRIPSIRSIARELQDLKREDVEIHDRCDALKARVDSLEGIVNAVRKEAVEMVDASNQRLTALEAAVSVWLKHSESLFARITALESQARPFQESGELAVGREGDCTCGIRPDSPRGPNHGPGCPAEVTAETIGLLRGMLALAKAERDAAIARADEAERDLVDAVATTQATATARDEYYRRFKFVEAERDVARDALRKIADPNIGLKYVRIIAKEALDGSGQHE